jgi:aspartyl-tRNA(Asn)/glutamyl-tRNA(Gln) amidotransferase subunit B
MVATYTPDIGLEVHAELNTKTKVFCGSLTAAGAPPNTQVCPICLGFPGVLPMLNRQVVEYGLRLALALNCEISRPSIFERKGYYYPDLPKNFQISQKRAPLGRNGFIEFTVDTRVARVHISDVHIEEDAAKLIHPEGDPDHSLVDFNRAGIPLLEIVSEPDMHSVEEVEAYMTAIRSALLYLGISEARMEMGQVRFEASISVRPEGATELGTRIEVKNLNSFRAVSRAVAYEIERQTAALNAGEKLTQETRLWDEVALRTEPMRTKETAMDYRYFPEPDLTPLDIDQAWIDRVKAELPELAEPRRERLMREYGLSDYDAGVLTTEKALADVFEEAVRAGAPAKSASNWLTGEFLRLLNERGEQAADASLRPAALAELIALVEQGQLNAPAAKTVFARIAETGESPGPVVEGLGLRQISDEAQLSATVDEVLRENPDAVANFRAGNEKSIGFLVGQVMRKSGKRANPQLVNQLIREKLGG